MCVCSSSLIVVSLIFTQLVAMMMWVEGPFWGTKLMQLFTQTQLATWAFLCFCKLQVHRKSCSHSNQKWLWVLTKPKLLRVSLGLQITRAPPWRFPPKIQSCLVPPLPPPSIFRQQLSFHYPSNGPPPLNAAFPAVLVPSWHPPLLHIVLLVARRGGCKEGTNTTGKVTLRGRDHSHRC